MIVVFLHTKPVLSSIIAGTKIEGGIILILLCFWSATKLFLIQDMDWPLIRRVEYQMEIYITLLGQDWQSVLH